MRISIKDSFRWRIFNWLTKFHLEFFLILKSAIIWLIHLRINVLHGIKFLSLNFHFHLFPTFETWILTYTHMIMVYRKVI
jgi:hypothetical protein